MKGSKVLPESWLRLMTPEDRKAIGQMSAEEALQAFTARNERQLQTQIVSLLRLKGIEVCWHRTDKKSAATIGWPDLTFAVALGTPLGHMTTLACAWEIKLPEGKLSREQIVMGGKLQTYPNHWRYRVIYSVQQALTELRQMGIQ